MNAISLQIHSRTRSIPAFSAPPRSISIAVIRLAVALLLTAIPTFAQTEPPPPPPPAEVEDPEYLIQIDVGYNTAFRMKYWTSVDVQVMNEREDISGWVEVRMYGPNNQLQSPIYRMPGDFPQNSRKRFRFNCYFDGTERVEAWLYDSRNRPLVDVPSYIQLQPIEPKDRLVTILDNDPLRYGFLYSAIQPEDETLRLHRFNLLSSDFALLPNHAQAYRAFDGIVIGEIEPTRMPIEQRELLRRYVEQGGTLIITTGLNGPNYRGTWIEELAGVTIGDIIETNDRNVAEGAFQTTELRRGASEEDHCVLAELVPNPEVRVLGNPIVLATARKIGRGTVYTLAVDITTGALSGNEGYRRFWQESLARADAANQGLNYEGVTVTAASQLPHLAGVIIRDRGFVITYLALYIGLGVIANWLFWSRLKRREYAWVTLLIVSAGFTGYAMYTGSAGWGRSAQTHQVEVIYLPPGGGPAEYHAVTGIFAARTTEFEGPVTVENALVYDAARAYANMVQRQTTGFGMPALIRPFHVVQLDDPRIERFRVGASELRLAQIQGTATAEGGFKAELSYTNERLVGAVTNNTPHNVANLALVLDGAFIPLQPAGHNRWNVDIAGDAVRANRGNESDRLHRWSAGGDYMEQTLRLQALWSLLSAPEVPGQSTFNMDLPPLVVGWAGGNFDLAFAPEGETEGGTALRLIAAAIDIRYPDSEERTRWAFPVNTGTYGWTTRADHTQDERIQDFMTQVPGPHEIFVRPTQKWLDDPQSTLELRVAGYFDAHPDYPNGIDLILTTPDDLSRKWHDKHLVEVRDIRMNNQREQVKEYVYRIENWQASLGGDELLHYTILGIPPGAERLALDDTGAIDMPRDKFWQRPNAYIAISAGGYYRAGYEKPKGTLTWR